MLEITLEIAMGCVLLGMLITAVRLVIGPTMPDRVLAFDALYVYAAAFAVLLGIRYDSRSSFEAALLIALLGYVGTTALARYLIRGALVE